MSMCDARFELLIDDNLSKTFQALVAMLSSDMKVDFSTQRELAKEVGLVPEDGVMYATCKRKASRELDRLAGEWVHQYVPKYSDMDANAMMIRVSDVCITLKESVHAAATQRLTTSSAARAGNDINREFITVDANGTARFVEWSGKGGSCALLGDAEWVKSRLYLVLEIKIAKRRVGSSAVCMGTAAAEVVPSRVVDNETPIANGYKPEKTTAGANRTQRGLVIGHECLKAKLMNLRSVYEFGHKPCQIYTSVHTTEMVCCVPKECFNSLGTEGTTNSEDIARLEEWHRCIKPTFLMIVLVNLWLCGDKRRWELRLDADPKKAHDIDPALRDTTDLTESAISDLRERQVLTNLKLIARCLRYFVGKGQQPKFRVQFYNRLTGRTSSGKAAAPWHLIFQTFEAGWGENGDNLPVRTPVVIVRDASDAKAGFSADPDIEELLCKFESNPLDTLKEWHAKLVQNVADCATDGKPKAAKSRKRKQRGHLEQP
jgi:hypothetical protein